MVRKKITTELDPWIADASAGLVASFAAITEPWSNGQTEGQITKLKLVKRRMYGRERGQKGAAHAYNIKSHREEERRWVEQAEVAYARFVAGWNPRGPKRVRTGAATEVRR